MLTIRLQRMGKPKEPTFRFIISENHKDTMGDSLEILGNYNPRKKGPDGKPVLNIKRDRIEYWLLRGAQASDTVRNLFLDAGFKQGVLKDGVKKGQVTISKIRKAKLAEQAKKT